MFRTPPHPFESLKNELLAAVYTRDGQRAGTVYKTVCDLAGRHFPGILESEEKMLRQIQVAFRRFRPFLLGSSCAPDLKKHYTALQALLHDLITRRSKRPAYVTWDAWKKKMNLAPWQMEKIFETAITFQMTAGCSNFCRRCNEWALPGIRAHFSKQAVHTLLNRLAEHNNTDLALYGASDPLDWEDRGVTLADVAANAPAGANYSLLTKMPVGRDHILLSLAAQNIGVSVSVTARNRNRIIALETRAGLTLQKQHDSNDLLIPAGLDEDFASVKPSITDAYGTEITPEGAFIIIPTFTSPLYPFGHKKIAVTPDTAFFPVKKIGRQALLADYFKPLETTGKSAEVFRPASLLPVQVETLLLDNGSDDLTPPGMRSVKEYFDVFGEKARLRRRQMTRSVALKLKHSHLAGTRYQDLPPGEKQALRDELDAHLFLTRKKNMADACIHAISFFLSAIDRYLPRHPVESILLRRLAGSEYDGISASYNGPVTPDAVCRQISQDPSCAWRIFRFFALSRLMGAHETRVTQLIRRYPARYYASGRRFAAR